jgi:ABC-2 type transport system ATP-binding protein
VLLKTGVYSLGRVEKTHPFPEENEDMNRAVEVQNLQKRYGDVRAADGVSFVVRKGEIFGLLGPNGAGKTTIVECLMGLREPDSGEMRVLGREHGADSRAIRAQIGVQLQRTGLLPQLTVWEQLSLFRDLSPQALPAERVLELVGLHEQRALATKSLSGGQKQRLAVGLALINKPEMVFLDEPTAGLDPQARRALWGVIRDLRRNGKTVLLTTHYMEEAEQLCDRVAILDFGRIIEIDSPEALVHRYFKETALEFVPVGDAPREELCSLPATEQVMFEDGHILLYTRDVLQTMAGLFALVSSQRLDFCDMTIRQATLEDVFLKLTGRRIRT